ncbi:D-alanyl-D-alanine carboxypeptidase/D-alanyl-D-alanine-endopeptidase (penicillin-binding protein 4) [Kitasatospora sp. MAP12-15]|uniref:D-alanyl-D-alanine carboxypeptidase/D-alanyl-D-alanine endopeptidase n=1 Tax=unclassified Kitasatospora TaxID=2633591 RepID=UPI002476E9FA|nr:D-alanyl-D-alanine carboxypeptidase/D-alanyl-D-alanine-endopeptidase [Kitasatospora sp. MAP12-44]MDH6108657.1 D-alanyl-D-alanine carboxypeptidase/D-alanyl-D-alanine-endopeptidase (penicillin-binding protein 4) [Kitasatospora sp. MAP12-44]
MNLGDNSRTLKHTYAHSTISSQHPLAPRRPAAPLAAVLATVLATLLLTGSGPAPAPPAPLAADLDRLLTDPRLTGAEVTGLVTDATTGEVLYRHDPGALVLPASTLKTVTAAAALELLGPDHRFSTQVLAAGPRAGGELDGDLVLRGGGDPTLLPADLDALAGQVAAAGITTVAGAVAADSSRYDDVPLGADWAWDDQAAYYSPQISALTLTTDTDYDPGTVRLTLTPDPSPGQPATVRLTPPDAPVQVGGQVATGAAGGDYTVQTSRRPGGNAIVLSGSLPAGGGPHEEWVTVEDPAKLAATVFAAALARHGVTVRDGVHDGASGAVAGADAVVLAAHDSQPLSELMVPFLKLSNNGIAEHLVKEIGRVKSGAGSWAAGLDQVEGFLRRAGLESTPARQVDGSGLSRQDLLTAQRLCDLLEFARRQPWSATFYQALPVAGDARRMVGGTLKDRLRGTAAEGRVHAKTGSLTGVDTLAGYVERPDGHTLAFALLVDNFVGADPRPVIDAFVLRLVSDSATSPAPAGSTGRRRSGAHDWENSCAAQGSC